MRNIRIAQIEDDSNVPGVDEAEKERRIVAYTLHHQHQMKLSGEADRYGRGSYMRQRIRLVNTGQEWPSIVAAANELGIKGPTIAKAVEKHRATRKGLRFERVGAAEALRPRKTA